MSGLKSVMFGDIQYQVSQPIRNETDGYYYQRSREITRDGTVQNEFIFRSTAIVFHERADGVVDKVITRDQLGRETTEDNWASNAALLKKYFDTQNSHLYDELDVTKGPDGKVTGAQIVLDQNIINAGGSIGQIFGSALGSALGGHDQLTRLTSNVVGGTIGGLIGQKFGLVVATSMAADLSKVSLVDVFASQNLDISSAGLGAVSSFLTAELGNVLQIPGFGGQLFNATTNSFTLGVLSQVKASIVNGLSFEGAIAAIDWSAAVSGAIAATPLNVGNVLGTFLGQLLVPAKSHAGAIGGQLLGAIGSFLLPGVGSLIGSILGTVIGDLFGNTPHPAATDLLDQAGDHYAATHYQTSSSDGGAFSVPDQLADPALAIINGYLKAVNGAALDHSKQVTIGYQTDRSRRAKARRHVRTSGWRPAKGATASIACIHKRFA